MQGIGLSFRLFFFLPAVILFHKAVLAEGVPSIVASYASRTYGPGKEACSRNGKVITPSEGWQESLEKGKPGDIFLLRAGIYRLTGTLKLPAGGAGNGITIQPHNCEAAIILGESSRSGYGTLIRPGSYNVIAGLYIESATHEKLIEIDDGITHVEFRNNRLHGGRNDAIRIVGAVTHISFSGNDINSGPGQPYGVTKTSGGHVFVIANINQQIPDHVRIAGKKIRGAYFGDVAAGDDTVAIGAGNNVVIERNYFTENYNIEEVIDIKSRQSRVPVVIRENVFHNNFLGSHGGQDSRGKVQFGPEITIGDHDTPPGLLQHVIDSNLLERGISVGPGKRPGSALIKNNVIRAKEDRAQTIIFNHAFNTVVVNNTYYRGGFKIGRAGGCIPPGQLTFKNNIFYETFVRDQTKRCDSSPYTLTSNILFKLPSRFERGLQTSNINADPLFVDARAGDLRSQVEPHPRSESKAQAVFGAVIGPVGPSH
jgi:hypothetical protein